jgi:hypothetical protein
MSKNNQKNKDMKAIILSLVTTLGAFFSYGQTLSEPITPPSNSPPLSQVFLNSNFASAGANSQYQEEALYRDRAERNCARYKSQQTVGAVFTGIGGAFLGAGIPMLIAGNNAIYNDSYYNPYTGYYGGAPRNDYALRNGGIACIIVGAISLSYGLPNVIVGSIRYNRNCGRGSGVYDRDRGRSYMELRTNGTNLALNF